MVLGCLLAFLSLSVQLLSASAVLVSSSCHDQMISYLQGVLDGGKGALSITVPACCPVKTCAAFAASLSFLSPLALLLCSGCGC